MHRREFVKSGAAFLSLLAMPKFNLPDMYHSKSKLMALNSDNPEKVVQYLINLPKHTYGIDDLRMLTALYVGYCNMTGVDWMLALSQNFHETAQVRSWWAAEPRRNPAGLGVSGRVSRRKPKSGNWVYDERRGLWAAGMAFETWDAAVRAHVSTMLCYALTDAEMTHDQYTFSQVCPGIPRQYRGCAKTLLGFNGRWAVPGRTYAQKLAAQANVLKEWSL